MEFKLGVRAHDLSEKKSPEELTDLISKYGFSYIQLVFHKALKDYSYDEEYVKRVADLLKKKNITVAMLGAYFNPVHSDRSKVLAGIENFKSNLRIAKFFNNPYVGSETGSYNDSPWTYVPKNHTEEGYQETKKVFQELTAYAEEEGSDITIESAWGHVIYSYQEQARLLKELNSNRVHATVDLFNLLYEGNFDKRDEIFEGALKTLGSEVKIIHLKDAKIIDGKLVQLAPGEGDFHFKFMIDTIRKYSPDATLIFEGVKADKIDQSKNLIISLMK